MDKKSKTTDLKESRKEVSIEMRHILCASKSLNCRRTIKQPDGRMDKVIFREHLHVNIVLSIAVPGSFC